MDKKKRGGTKVQLSFEGDPSHHTVGGRIEMQQHFAGLCELKKNEIS